MQQHSVVAFMRVVRVRYVVGEGNSGPGGGAQRKVRDTRSMLYRKAVASVE